MGNGIVGIGHVMRETRKVFVSGHFFLCPTVKAAPPVNINVSKSTIQTMALPQGIVVLRGERASSCA
ncbi:hypothetical protein [Rhizobium leguminosarum]|uniref:hypothetical protein n=1 Tax=Rhizobium leguminosarum TaxID=384 RepID=UPI001C912C26|nr:hypothetical protein [Rhizobium leguminosarum]MBY2937597.1 hypothetical protein [Rhizobium leguminosarum]